MRIVIAGAGMAGLHVAESLRGQGFDGTITLVGAESHPPYSRPPLSKEFLTGKGRGDDVGLRGSEELDALRLDLRLGNAVVALDAQDQTVTLGDGTILTYDRLVIATGVSPRRPDTDLAGVHALRTLEDAGLIRDAIRTTNRVVVVGAGFIGAEIAASARALGAEVTLLEAATTPMTRAVDPRIGAVLGELHRDNGVDLRLGSPVAAYEGDGRVERVRLADGSAVDAPMVVVGTGVTMNTEWLRGSGVDLDPDGSVRCDEYCATSLPNVYAAGDLASWPHPLFGGRLRLEHWTNAAEQGAVVAHNLLAEVGERTAYTPVPYFFSDQYGMKIQLLGQAAPAETVEFVHGSPEERKFVAFIGRGDQLVGVFGLRSTPKVMRYRPLLHQATSWAEALAAAR
ncbi:NAD(P)/FAD-dependent oxidoreductase [Spiractinospora alimapuensis]|uniref:NAD(P)/FAD-dependent oxidoreductase n=1 Tax=Spiractinospora alimapuensis TaxID=2820884 RepID=UPI0022AA0BAB|nr:FAD-dependent oxidoreductase [Spiractinospora alimapuensis]